MSKFDDRKNLSQEIEEIRKILIDLHIKVEDMSWILHNMRRAGK